MGRTFLLLLLLSIMCFSCSNYSPKPRGYFRIDLPEKKYTLYNPASCPFSFEYPVYAKVVNDQDPHAEPCWINVEFPSLNGKIHLSYKSIQNNFARYSEDARVLAYKHTIKAEAITETLINKGLKFGGIKYNIEGDAASSVQFFVTDSSRHFLRGALYFTVITHKDSLLPVIQFVEKDIDHLIGTLKWKD
jgi:gliding motility-associated lipoprotein GldD